MWFEFFQVALHSQDKAVKAALLSSREYYRHWEIGPSTKFDSWWKDRRAMFEEQFKVRELKRGEEPLDPDALVVEIPLTESPTKLVYRVRALINTAYEVKKKNVRKSKKTATSVYKLSNGAEPKFGAIRDMLLVYRDVHLKQPTLKGEALLIAVRNYYEGLRGKSVRPVPIALQYRGGRGHEDSFARASRSLRRYLQKAEKIVFNVANGQFPGEY